jgi:sugar O-acyltransferase (sialic acid O-acetyltransferase NeuD family)
LKTLFIIGSGGHTRSVLSAAKLMDKWGKFKIIDLNFNNQSEIILGAQVLPVEALPNKLDFLNHDVFISVGDNKKREEIFTKFNFDISSYTNIIHPKSYIDKHSKMGLGNYFGQFSNIGSEVEVGNFNIINTHANLEHEVKVGNFNHLAPSSCICGRSKLSNNIFIGCNSVVIEKINVAKNNYIGAGTVVIRSIIKENGKYIGIPAKEI